MSRWNEQFNSNPFHNTWKQFNDLSKKVKGSHLKDKTTGEEYARLRKITEFINETLNGLDPELVTQSQLNDANQNASNVHSEFNTFNSNGNLANLQNANNYLDNILIALRKTVSIPTGNEKKSLTAAANAYSKAMDDHLKNYRLEIDRNLSEVDEASNDISTSLTELKDELAQSRSELEGTQQTIQTQTAEFHTQFQQSEKSRSDEFDKVIDTLNAKIDDEFKVLASKAATTLDVLQKFQNDAEKVLGVILDTTQAGSYYVHANKEKFSANILRLLSTSLMLIAALILAYPLIINLINSTPYTFHWQAILGRITISSTILATAFYLAKESSKHRENANRDRRRELIITTIGPYLALMKEDEDKEELKKEIARSLFKDDSKAATPGENHTANILAQLSSLLRASKEPS